nr:hypothetical protein [Planctomycetota bacterium]
MNEAARVRVAAVGKFDALHLGHRALAGRAHALGAATLLGFSGMAGILGWPARLPIVAASDRARVLDAWEVSESWLPFAEIQPLDVEAFVRLLATRLRFGAVVV